MKLLVVSDVVEPSLYKQFDRAKFPAVDLIVSCGDLPPEYLSFLSTAFDAPMVYVKGNHDIRYAHKPPAGGIDIHASLFRFQGLKFLGLEGSRWYNGGPYQYREAEMRRIAWRLRLFLWWKGGVDIVVAHAPPRHVGDADDRCHRGFETFRALIERYRPMYFLHGHIHKLFDCFSERTTAVGETKVVNCCGHIFLDIETKEG